MSSNRERRDGGHILIFGVIMMFLLGALVSAHFFVTQKSFRQSVFMNELRELRHHAEAGVKIAFYEMIYEVGSADGNIGTDFWEEIDDLGRDGIPGTNDEGEADGSPTPGELNLVPIPIGPAKFERRLLVRTTDTAWPGVKRVVSTAFSSEAMAIVEVHARKQVPTIPHAGAIILKPDTQLDFNGNSFKVSGKDTNPDNSKGSEDPTYALSTEVGDPPGSNSDAISLQIDSSNNNQLTGVGGSPSLAESSEIQIDELYEAFLNSKTHEITPGKYTSPNLGSPEDGDLHVTYSNGNLKFSGQGEGAGILIVDGDLEVSGQFTFTGVVLVRGDVKLSGGGSGIQIYGALIVGQSMDGSPSELTVTGNSDILYSSEGVNEATGLLKKRFLVLSWHDLK